MEGGGGSSASCRERMARGGSAAGVAGVDGGEGGVGDGGEGGMDGGGGGSGCGTTRVFVRGSLGESPAVGDAGERFAPLVCCGVDGGGCCCCGGGINKLILFAQPRARSLPAKLPLTHLTKLPPRLRAAISGCVVGGVWVGGRGKGVGSPPVCGLCLLGIALPEQLRDAPCARPLLCQRGWHLCVCVIFRTWCLVRVSIYLTCFYWKIFWGSTSLGSFLLFHSSLRASDVVGKKTGHLGVELRGAVVAVSEVRRGAASAIGNLLASARALRMRSADVSSCQIGRAGLRIQLVGRLVVYSRREQSPHAASSRRCSCILEVSTSR